MTTHQRSENKPIQLGLCCINMTLRAQKPSIFMSRKMIMRTIREQGIDVLKSKILENLNDLLLMIEWNERNGIKVFRLSSELFPHKTNPEVEDYSYDFARELLAKAGELARSYNQRLTFHPGQYNVLGSPNEKALQKTIEDLGYHADVLDLMGMGPDSVMVIHGGGMYGDKPATRLRWCENYRNLPDKIKRRLVLENCEKCFSIKDCILISKEVGVPIVFDTHHYDCYKLMHPKETFDPPEDYMGFILESWHKRGIKPKFHVSEQGSGRCGHHSDYIETIPDYLLNIPDLYLADIDIMIEAKKKELAVFKLYEKYPQLNCSVTN